MIRATSPLFIMPCAWCQTRFNVVSQSRLFIPSMDSNMTDHPTIQHPCDQEVSKKRLPSCTGADVKAEPLHDFSGEVAG